MNRSQPFAFCLLATLSLSTALAQTSIPEPKETPAASTSPVAYVYVSRPTHLDAFAASSSGKLTAVPGSPFSDISVYHMSATKKFLFGASDDNEHILTYAIGSNGAVKQVSSVDAQSYSPQGSGDCCYGPQRLDATGTTLYNFTDYHFYNPGQESFKIESNGALKFIGNASAGNINGADYEPEISVLGNNKFAYQTSCDFDTMTQQLTYGYKRESSGALQGLAKISFQVPTAAAGEVYCPLGLTTDPSDHLAFALQAFSVSNGEAIGSLMVASYTAASNGNLTTKNTSETLATVSGGYGVGPMSISPSGKLLAVADVGFQVFHFNGSDPITNFTGDLHSSEKFVEFGWDNDNHLYALSQNYLHVYEATSTEIKEVSGSPYSIPEASSVIVVSK